MDPHKRQDPSQVKILLIDDDPLVLKSLETLLKRQGYEVTPAKRADEGIAWAEKRDFNLVISDIRMPGKTGIAAIQKIKEIFGARRVPCGYMLITGYAEEDTPAHAIRLGVDKFLFKPFDNEAFLQCIAEGGEGGWLPGEKFKGKSLGCARPHARQLF
jgi:CheY-like chemotaxis protein